MSLEIHHFGLVVADLKLFLAQSIWEARGTPVDDPLQQARLCWAAPAGAAGAPLVELVQPLGEGSPVWRAAQKGPAWHHVCLVAPTRAEADAYALQKRMLPVVEWRPAVLFGGKTVRFAFSRNRELVEFLSDEPAG